MKKTLVLTEVFFPEEFIINELVRLWSIDAKHVEVLTRVPSYPSGTVYKGYSNSIFSKSIFEGVSVYHIPIVRGYQKSIILKILNYLNYITCSFIFLLFNGRKYDRIFVYQTGPLTNALSVSSLKFHFKWKIILWSQDLWPDTVYAYGLVETKFNRFILDNLVRYIYQRCDIILVSCKGFIPRIKRFANDKTFFWIPNWSLTNFKMSDTVVLSSGFHFTFAGNIGKVQNLENLILAFGFLNGEFPDVYFNIYGDGSSLESLIDFVRKRDIKNVIFHGRKSSELMPKYFQDSDVLVISLIDSPAYKIMMPSKFQSYLNARKPIFSVVSGELNNLIEEYNLGFTAEPSNIDSINYGFRKFIGLSETEKMSMISNCEKVESKYFDKRKLYDQLTSLIFD